MSDSRQGFTLTHKVRRCFLISSRRPTYRTVNQPHYVEMLSYSVMSSKQASNNAFWHYFTIGDVALAV